MEQSLAPITLLGLPLEIHLAIVSELTSLQDVEQLGLTCQAIRSTLLSLGGPAIQKVAEMSFFAYEDCLRVTRVKLLPISTLQQYFEFDLTGREYTNPPDAAFFESLVGPALSLVEASRMLRLRAIAADWEQKYTEAAESFMLRDKWVDSVREGFYRAAYRYMLLGVVFSQAYLYPQQLVQQANSGTELGIYPPYTKDEVLYRAQMGLLYAGFGEWLAADGARRPTPDWPDYDHVERLFAGRKEPITASERGSLTEIMLLFSVADDDCIISQKHNITYTPQAIQDIKDGKHKGSTIKLYADCGTNEQKYIVSDCVARYQSTSIGPPYANWQSHWRYDVGYGVEIEFFQVMLKQTLGLRLSYSYFDAGSETKIDWRYDGGAFIEAGDLDWAPYTLLVEDVGNPHPFYSSEW